MNEASGILIAIGLVIAVILIILPFDIALDISWKISLLGIPSIIIIIIKKMNQQ